MIIVGATCGFLVGLPSRRLSGDYLAIVTLFFLEIFLTLATNGDQIFGHDFTGGAERDPQRRPAAPLRPRPRRCSTRAPSRSRYLYVAVAVFAVVYVALHFVNHSRTGRAWRSQREDPLAAEAMGMPVNLIKLMAFGFGAAIAALTGTLFASLNASVFPLTFSFPLLITVYTMVILGGQGNLAGVTVGAVLVSVLLELLRDPGDARILFYLFGVLALALRVRQDAQARARARRRSSPSGSPRTAIAGAINDDWISGPSASGLDRVLSHWIIIPTAHGELARPGLVHRPDRARPRAHAAARLGALHPARADASTSARSSGRTSCWPSPTRRATSCSA